MNRRTISQRTRTFLAPALDALGTGAILRKAYVEINLVGERAKFMIHGRPPASSAIVLAGSGRSGTTWLQEVLCTLPRMQPIFEALHPRHGCVVYSLVGSGIPNGDVFGWYLAPDKEDPAWTNLLNMLLTGRLRNYWTDYERVSYFPSQYLVKTIHSNMMLGYIYKRFTPRIIYIIRHPCAVIASRIENGWHADVRDLLAQNALLRDYVIGDNGNLPQVNDQVGAHAVWWALENRVAFDQLRDVPHFLVTYEQLVMSPNQVIESLCKWLGFEFRADKYYEVRNKPSRMSGDRVHEGNDLERLSSWKERLSIADCQRILNWAWQCGICTYDEHALPIHMRSAK